MFENLIHFVKTNKIAFIGFVSFGTFVLVTKKFYFNGGYFNDNGTASLVGKTVIITGSNTGIGKETALEMAKRGARVILACRDLTKAMKTAQQIRNETSNEKVFVELLDLASFDSIRKFSEKINNQEERIDILINNAGIMRCPKWKTKDGYEMQFGVNHLGHFLLTNLLLDKIIKSEPSRIINVSSRAHQRGKINWNDINLENDYEPSKAYDQSKLCNLLFTRQLAQRLKDTKVNVFALHPGVVRTDLGRYLPESFGWKFYFLIGVFYPIYLWMCKSEKQGAQTTIYCALSADLDDKSKSGLYFADCKPKQPIPAALNDQDAQRLWTLSEKLCNLSQS